MILKFNCKKNDFQVIDENGNVKYAVKLSDNGDFYGEIFDELCVSQLAEVKLAGDEYTISAFDSPIGTITKTETGYISDNGNIKIISSAEFGYFAELMDDNAQIVIQDSSVAMRTENEAQAILLIAVGLMLYNEAKKSTSKSGNTTPEHSDVAKPKQKKDILDALGGFKAKMGSFFENVGKLTTNGAATIWAHRRVTGKTALMLLGGIILSLVMFIVGIIGTTAVAASADKLEKADATVYVNGDEAIARFGINGYYYKIKVSTKYRMGQTIPVYYTLNNKGMVASCRVNQPSTLPYIVLTAFGAAAAISGTFMMFFGIPKLPPRSEWDNEESEAKNQETTTNDY